MHSRNIYFPCRIPRHCFSTLNERMNISDLINSESSDSGTSRNQPRSTTDRYSCGLCNKYFASRFVLGKHTSQVRHVSTATLSSPTSRFAPSPGLYISHPTGPAAFGNSDLPATLITASLSRNSVLRSPRPGNLQEKAWLRLSHHPTQMRLCDAE